MTIRRLVVISDLQEGAFDGAPQRSIEDCRRQWLEGARGRGEYFDQSGRDVAVKGGYIERLPLACLKTGMVDSVEVWTHWRGDHPPAARLTDDGLIVRRAFRMNGPAAPHASNDMLAHIQLYGAPDILCIWGLGVSEDILEACAGSFKIYNSIDAPALRVPAEVSRHFDLVLTGAEWQSDAVTAQHPGMPTLVLPIGPEFASETTFYPLDTHKPYDVIYVAAAQAYKRHDVLFQALTKLPRSLRALCVFGYGEMAEALRGQARDLAIDVDFVGPPGVPFAEVNRLMNQAKIGVVCGVDDGAPAILTEYMLAGLPVLANRDLVCGLQYITPATGRTEAADDFHHGISAMLDSLRDFSPRRIVRENWTWEHSVRRLVNALSASRKPQVFWQKTAGTKSWQVEFR